jgi:hypothetical protein
LQHAKAVLPVGDIRIQTGVRHRHADGVGVVNAAAGVKGLVEFWLLGFFNVNYRDAFLAIGDIGVSTGDIDVMSVLKRHRRRRYANSLAA